MFRIIYPNRWFVWTIAIIFAVFIVLEGAIVQFAIEQYTQGVIISSIQIPKRANKQASIDDFDTSNSNCIKDADCWCRPFDGAHFSPGKVQSKCNLDMNRCAPCFYE